MFLFLFILYSNLQFFVHSYNVGTTVYLAHGDVCTKFVLFTMGQEVTVTEVDCPVCDYMYKEAHTRLFLHAKFTTDKGARSITICSPDTSVAIIAFDALWRLPLGTTLLFHTGINFSMWVISRT